MSKEPARKICKLDDVVINRIAAGEVVQRPCNAIKELIENSIDAGSSSISVVVDDGGLKFIQITDSGHGIRKEDLGIVCERFTTSKLRTFSDLTTISTHGFRGEALASISHVSHVSIMTKTEYDKCAWIAHYKDGKLHPKKPGASSEPKACAGNQGTTITAEDLFYNMPTRKRALNGRDEFTRIAHVITCYAVHNSHIAFNLKKLGENMPKIRTSVTPNKIDTISNLYGPAVGKELLEFKCEDKNYGFTARGHLTNANYNGKVFRFILFINNRLVESSAAKKALEGVYSSVLPKHTYPFVYLSIDINPQNVDVNVHPTKNEVHFLHEDSIIAGIQAKIEQTLYACASSRNYYVQSRLPEALAPEIATREEKPGSENKAKYDYQLVRTDCNQTKLDPFLTDKKPNPVVEVVDSKPRIAPTPPARPSYLCLSDAEPCSSKDIPREAPQGSNVGKENINTINTTEESNGRRSENTKPNNKRPVYLTSVLELQESICSGRCEGAVELLKGSQYVGVASTTYILVQVTTKLYMFDFVRISRAFFYQKVIFDFQNFNVFEFTEPAPIRELVMMALEDDACGWNSDHGSKSELGDFATHLLTTKRDMLEDYFGIVVTESGELIGLPILLEGFYPLLFRIPMFLLRLATEVEWTTEKECFRTIAEELAEFYSLRLPPDEDEKLATASTSAADVSDTVDPNVANWRFTLEHVLFPQIRSSFIPDSSLTGDGSILQVADLHDLYKVFERC